METGGDRSALRYVEASAVRGPAGDLDHTAVHGLTGQKLGDFDGVLVDPPTRRVRYYVIRRPGWFGRQHLLLPASRLAQICRLTRALRIDIDAEELRACPTFDGRSVPAFSDHDLLDSIFRRRVA